jgi:hypothetical protein
LNINNIAAWCTVGAFVFLFIGHVSGFFKMAWEKISVSYQNRMTKKNNVVIHLENTMFPNITTWWSLGNSGDTPGMQICGNLKATNNSKKEILLTGCYINKFKCRGQVLTYSAFYQLYSTQYSIHPNSTTKISINFWIETSMLKAGDDFISDIAIIDNFGKKHWVKKVKFGYVGNK